MPSPKTSTAAVLYTIASAVLALAGLLNAIRGNMGQTALSLSLCSLFLTFARRRKKIVEAAHAAAQTSESKP
jgi:hypothetical protein